ncbi:MAG: sigma 54-interacting transcriptional regulator [Desulfovibrio sp.]|jgi:transcriptional regulator with PAS, ATPase and Fis domain|nr:sigma 54-interacting transcriptional regulator [Desulfovibrio sp.]
MLNYELALIAPYGELARMIEAAAQDYPCNLHVREGISLDDAESAGRDMERTDKPEVIISRGGIADRIRQAVGIPVVSISFTPADVLRTLLPFVGMVRKVALFSYKRHVPDIAYVSKALGIVLDEYLFTTSEEVLSGMVKAKYAGAELAVGGILTTHFSRKAGLKGILLEVSMGAAKKTLEEAISLAEIRRGMQRGQASLQVVVNSIAEGLLITDFSNRLTLANHTAERILGASRGELIGRDVREVVPNTRMDAVMASGVAEQDSVQEIRGKLVVTNRFPIVVDEKPVGVVCTFREDNEIFKAEATLRSRMKKGFSPRYALSDMLTCNAAMRERVSLARAYARTDAAVLLLGESGTGKELFAQGIHCASRRSGRPFVAVNCAAIPESLLESELFGYEEGAFTGAKRQGKAGLFELAHMGTLLLDEISELPILLQSRLLRVLQEKEVMRIGGSHVVPIDVRLICTSNKDLEEAVRHGRFRHDLFYRLNVLPISIPALRDREEDIPLLAAHYLRIYSGQFSASPDAESIVAAIADKLLAHDWPGNVRELCNAMERLAIALHMFPEKDMVSLLDVLIRGKFGEPEKTPSARRIEVDLDGDLKNIVKKTEKAVIGAMLARHGNDQVKAARQLGISRMSLWRKIRQTQGTSDSGAVQL